MTHRANRHMNRRRNWPAIIPQRIIPIGTGRIVEVVESRDFAGRLSGFYETLRQGNAETGMVVRVYGHKYRVRGAEGTRQWLERM